MASNPPGKPSVLVIDPHVAHKLEGLVLPDGWVLKERTRKARLAPDETGGNFSVGYIAERDGRKAFVKVFDLGGALLAHAGNIMKAMMMLGQEHQYECQLLDICDAAKLDRIVRVLGRGQADIPMGDNLTTPIPYIVFEQADKDIRKALAKTDAIEDAWRLRMLHQVAVGLSQLHSKQIAHQDLKPSNVLIFEQDDVGAKIGDLGRASRNDGSRANHDAFCIAGDPAYAPPEQAYGVRAESWRDRRDGCDLYHLGSLIAFVFTGTTPNRYYLRLPTAIRPLAWGGKWVGSYPEVVHHISAAFVEYLALVRPDFPSWAADDLVLMVSQMCDPQYLKRGDPEARKQVGNPIGLDRFISRLDVLANRAKIAAKTT